MNVSYNGHDFLVRFFYSRNAVGENGAAITLQGREALRNDSAGGQVTTTCNIEARVIDPNNPARTVGLILASGKCTNDSRDRFSKDVGRKLALKRALGLLKNKADEDWCKKRDIPVTDFEPYGVDEQSKFRLAIWQNYFVSHRSQVDKKAAGLPE